MAADSEKLPFRWSDVLGYALFFVETVLILVFIVGVLLQQVRRPETVSLSVTGGSVLARRLLLQSSPENVVALEMEINLRAENPSRRARMYYIDVTTYLFSNTTASAFLDPEHASVVAFRAMDIAVPQRAAADYSLQVTTTNRSMPPESFDSLYHKTDANMSDAAMRLDGNLIIETAFGINRTHPTTYFCWPLVLGVDANNVKGFLGLRLKDVFCRVVQLNHFI